MPIPSGFALNEVAPTKQTKSGWIKVADSSTFKASKTIAVGLVTIHPGGMREMHWHPNADEWQYFIAGTGDLTVFNTGPNVASNTFHAGDIGYVKKSFGHYIRNIGNTDLVYLEVFRSSHYAEVSLSDWLTAHAAGDGGSDVQHRSGGDRPIPAQQPRRSACLKKSL